MMCSRVYRCLTRSDFTWCSHSLRQIASLIIPSFNSQIILLPFLHCTIFAAYILSLLSCTVPSLQPKCYSYKAAYILSLLSCIVPSLQPKCYSYKVLLNARMPIPVAALSKAWVCGRSYVGIAGSNPTGDMDVCFL
jgi:hypothetical protein